MMGAWTKGVGLDLALEITAPYAQHSPISCQPGQLRWRCALSFPSSRLWQKARLPKRGVRNGFRCFRF